MRGFELISLLFLIYVFKAHVLKIYLIWFNVYSIICNEVIKLNRFLLKYNYSYLLVFSNILKNNSD